jgi:hypothetical protein
MLSCEADSSRSQGIARRSIGRVYCPALGCKLSTCTFLFGASMVLLLTILIRLGKYL